MKNIDPLYDMTTYQGRFWHFFWQQSPHNLLQNEDEAREIVERFHSEKVVQNLKEYWNAKYVYDSSHHPVTGEKVNIFGRMSFQAPGNMFLTAFMVTFYKNPVAVVSLQFLNQSFNSNVNFSNSAAAVSVPSLIQKKISVVAPETISNVLNFNVARPTETEDRLFKIYVFAAGFACCVSLGLNL